MMRRAWFFLFAISATAAAVSPVAAQSIFATHGLGFPADPQDGRSRGLGGAALGFAEPEISWANPAAAIGFLVPGLTLSYQHDDFSAEAGGAEFEGATARFPMILTVIPAGERLSFQAGFGSFLDQTWRLEQPDTLILGDDPVGFVDRSTSEGGVTRLRLGGSYYVGGGLGIGLATDFLMGSVQREDGRIFGLESGLVNTVSRASWRYRGLGYTLGAHWSPGPQGGVGASVTYMGTLDARAEAQDFEDRSYELPLSFQVGGTGRVLPDLLVAVAGTWSGWSRVGDGLLSGAARDTWSARGGIEWDGIVIRDVALPLRLGGQTGVLPFGDSATDDAASERAVTLGLGALMAGGVVRPDIAVELGTRRHGAAMDESYWRLSASVRVLGR